MNIYIEIEVLKRELHGKLLLALELVKRNYTIYLTSRENLNYLALNQKITPGILFLKDMNSQKNRIDDYKKFVNNNFILVSQDEEIGCFNNNDFNEFFQDRFKGEKSEAFNYIDKYFCFGDFDFNYLKKFNFHTKFIKTGSPRIDFCGLDIEKKREKKKTILVSLNQNIFWKRDFIERFVIEVNDNLDDKLLNSLLKLMFEGESKDLILTFHVMNLIRKLSELDNFNILVRPHPAMDFEKVFALFNNNKLFKNINISDEGALIEQIINSDILLHFGCTSGIEAILNNKTTICYYPDDEYIKNYKKNSFLTNIGFNFTNEQNLFEFLNNIEKKKSEISLKIFEDKRKISDRVKIDGISYKRIADEIDKTHKKDNFNHKNSDKVFKNHNFKTFIKKKIFKYVAKKEINKTAFEIKFPEFNKPELRNKIEFYNKFFSINANFKLNFLNNRCLKISK